MSTTTAESTTPGGTATSETTSPETSVPSGETPAARCAYCDRPFRTERLHALHLGDAHRGAWTDAERAAHDDAVDDEEDDLFVFHITVVGAITLLYAILVLAYMIVLGAGL